MVRAGIAAALIAMLSACSSPPMRELQELLWSTKGDAALETGLRQYESGRYADSARNLQAAIHLGLSTSQRGIAHKHLAFMHCASNRERACREEFVKALAVDPQMQLSAAEAGHPVWGPIFRSLKGGGESPLSTGLRHYEEGNYAESVKSLQGAIERGLPEKERVRAHKHLAFIHCASNREPQCRDEFRRALALDPTLQLTAAEAGHPAWGPVFRSLRGEPSTPMKSETAPAAKGESAMLAGLRQYEDGNYEEAARSLENAITQGLPDRERARAHKQLAFIHCAAGRQMPCREEFAKALAAQPGLELAPAEAGHPAWGPVFRAVKAGR